jgi:hypothetical protein
MEDVHKLNSSLGTILTPNLLSQPRCLLLHDPIRRYKHTTSSAMLRGKRQEDSLPFLRAEVRSLTERASMRTPAPNFCMREAQKYLQTFVSSTRMKSYCNILVTKAARRKSQ